MPYNYASKSSLYVLIFVLKPFLAVWVDITCPIYGHSTQEIWCWEIPEEVKKEHQKISACF